MHERWVPRVGVLAAAVLVLGPLLGAAFAVPVVPAAAAADPAALELEIESTISLTKLNGSAVVDGTASVIGRIRLEPGSTPGTWHGRGELASTTSSGRGGCGSTHVEGEGTYDWVVNEVVVSPGIEAERIVAHMDAGPAVEAPDAFELDLCGSTIDGTLNTWENTFFFLHNADFGAKGFEVGGWQLQATGSTWADGELIATASWAKSCGNGFQYGCDEETVFRLYAAGAASVPSASPSATAGEPTPTPTAAAGGGLAVRTVEVAGLTLTNACLELWTDTGAGARGTLVADSARCDAPLDPTGQVGPEDGWIDGSLGWSGLAAGRYVVVETRPPTDGRGRYETAADTSVEISAGAVSALTLTHRLTDALTIYKVDAAGDPLPGACFAIAGQAGNRTGPPPGSAVCDGPAPVGSALPGDGLADGILVLPSNNLTGAAGTYSLIESRPPAGYAQIAIQTVELSPAAPTVLTVTNTTGSGGGLAVRTVEVAGLTLTNACLELWTDTGAGARGTLVADSARCDAPLDPSGQVGPEDGWIDGLLGWSGLAAGRYVVVETRPPTDGRGRYETAADTSVEISAGAVSALTLTHRLTDALTIYKVDAAGDPLPGACFAIAGQAGNRTGPPPGSAVCDGPAPVGSALPGDGLADGILVLPSNNLTGAAGTYSLIESRPPAGYAQIAIQTVELSPAAPTVLTVTNTTGSGGGLAVRTVEVAGLTLTNACLELWTDTGAGARGTLVADSARCDAPLDPSGQVGPEDGWIDGLLGWSGLAAGRYVVVETRPPTDGRGRYETAADTSVEISAGAVSALTLTHRLTDALTIYKVDAAGDPLPGACFAIAGQAGNRTGPPPGSAVCDGPAPVGSALPGDGLADGILVLPSNNLTGAAGTYSLIESRPPAGYAQIAIQTVELSPAAPTVLTVTNTTGAVAAPAPSPAPSPTPSPTTSPVTGPIAAIACDDVVDCGVTYGPFILGGLAAAGLAAFLGIQLIRRRSLPEPFSPPTLNAAAAPEPTLADISLTEQGLELTSTPTPGEVPGTGLDYEKLDYDKLTFDKLEGVDLESSTPDFEKLPPDADAPGSQLDYDKLDYGKLGPQPPEWK